MKTSHPLWLIKLWSKQYGYEKAVQMAKANNERVHVTIRVNGVKGTREELKQKLESEGITCTYGSLSEDALVVLKGNVIQTKAFEQGWFYVQDESSMLVGRALKPKHHSKVLDTCSAPGGKQHISLKSCVKRERYMRMMCMIIKSNSLKLMSID